MNIENEFLKFELQFKKRDYGISALHY